MTPEHLPLGWAYLPVAFALGALHALEPGHGKSIASAWLVSGKHSWRDAVVLGASTTFSHTFVVILLALASLGLTGFMSQARIEHGVALAGAILLLGMGAWVSFRAARDIRHGHAHHDHHHDHVEPTAGHGIWSVAALGMSNGVLPCPGALAALLFAISLGQWALGLATVLTYSLGLAAALTGMGIAVIAAGRAARAWIPSDRALLWLPLMSGVLVSATGVWLLLGHAH